MNELVNQEINEEFKNSWKHENENVTVQNLWDAEKVILLGKYTAIQAFLKKEQP